MISQNFILISGSTGSGKSNFLMYLLSEAIKEREIKKDELVLYDGKLHSFYAYEQFYDDTLINDADLIKRLENILKSNKPTYVFLDEFAGVMRGEKSSELEDMLSQLKRHEDVYVYATTSVSADDVITDRLLNIFESRVVFYCKEDTSYKLTNSDDAFHLEKPGNAIYYNSITKERRRLEIPYVSD